jgi:parvulin-like peptidyl-prolyl isomerase
MALKITVKATVTMPVSVTLNGDVKEPNDVTVRRNSNPPLPPFSKGGRGGLLLFALCSMLLFLVGCASVLQKENILAVVEGEPITEEDLKYSLNVTHRREDLSSASALNLSQYVQKLIDDRLIINEARSMVLDQSPEVQQAIQAYILRESVVRLHDEEIVQKVRVTEKDILEYYKKNYERFTLGLIEADTEENAKDLLEKLRKGENFAELAQKYSTHASKKEGGKIDLSRRSMPPFIEKAVASLKPEEFSDVIKAANKYYIIKLIKRKEAPDEELERLRGSIKPAIMKQKEKERSDEYLKYLRERATIKLDHEILSAISLGTSEELEKWSKDTRLLAEVNGTVLTVREFVASTTPYTRKSNEELLNSWLDRKLVDHEALSRNYENNPDLKKMLYRYENQLLKKTFTNKVILPQLVITDKTLEDYYSKHQKSFIKPATYRIQQITVKTLDEARDILNNLERGADFSWLAKSRSTDSAASKGGDAGWVIKAGLPAPVKEIIDTLKLGDLSPIIKIDSLYVVVKLQGKTEEEVEEFNKVKDAVYRASFKDQLSNLLEKCVNQLKTDAQVKIYEEQVRALEERLQR